MAPPEPEVSRKANTLAIVTFANSALNSDFQIMKIYDRFKVIASKKKQKTRALKETAALFSTASSKVEIRPETESPPQGREKPHLPCLRNLRQKWIPDQPNPTHLNQSGWDTSSYGSQLLQMNQYFENIDWQDDQYI